MMFLTVLIQFVVLCLVLLVVIMAGVEVFDLFKDRRTKAQGPCLRIYGVPKDLKFSLWGYEDHLLRGGLIRMEFNGDGTHMIVTKVFPAPHV